MSDVESAVHMPVARILASANAGTAPTDNKLREVGFRFNVKAYATANDNMRWLGRPDIWLKDEAVWLDE